MIGFLLFALVLVVVLYVVHLVLEQLGLPPQVLVIARLIVGVIALLLLVQRLGFVGF